MCFTLCLFPALFLLLPSLLVRAFDANMPALLDSAISTQSPHQSRSSDSCVGQCAFAFVDGMSDQLGANRSAGLLNLNYNDFLAAFANSSFFESFCKLYHEFNFCYTKCPHGYMQELLGRSGEIVDHFCVYNYKAIMEKFGCLAGLDRELSKKCLRSCTGHHNAVTSLMQNFKHLALNGDPTEAEKYLSESCEYVTCTLHCDVPAIYNLCGEETAELVINLTRKSFESMQRLALDTGAVSKWPAVCADIRTYSLPKAPQSPPKETNGSRVMAQSPELKDNTNGESNQRRSSVEKEEKRENNEEGEQGLTTTSNRSPLRLSNGILLFVLFALGTVTLVVIG